MVEFMFYCITSKEGMSLKRILNLIVIKTLK